MKTRRQKINIFEVLKEKNFITRKDTYIKNEGKIFSNEEKVREFLVSRSAQ